MAVRFVIIGGGPAGNQAASYAARHGAKVTLVERDVVGGAAHLWDCIPSKAMIATGGAMAFVERSEGMGLATLDANLDTDALKRRITEIEDHLRSSTEDLLSDQGVRVIRGAGRLTGPHSVAVEHAGGTEELEADAILVATGSRPRIPDWCQPDGDRILTTRQAYPPPVLPEHLVVIGSGVTGVEFVHMFASFGSKVTLVVSRQQVLPNKDPEVAAALEEEFLRRGVRLFIGARAVGIDRTDDGGVAVRCDDGRIARGSHALLAIGLVPNSDGLGLDAAGVDVDERGYVPVNQHCQSNVPHIYAAGDVSGKLPLSSVAAMQGRKIAEHVVAEAEAFATGRKIRVTKVPFSSNPKALINNDSRGFVKIVSDPATGIVLGGSIVGRHAAELISVLALAVTCNLRVVDVVDSLLVHPSVAESLTEAAE